MQTIGAHQHLTNRQQFAELMLREFSVCYVRK